MGPGWHYGTAVHAEFDTWLSKTLCRCGAEYLVDEFPVLRCLNGHGASVILAEVTR